MSEEVESMSKVTMKDVASVMGVSVMTVSNAFNRPDQLSARLRTDILARAEKMGYAGPDAAARQLRAGRSNAYGVVFAERLSYAFDDPFSTAWLAAFAQVMEADGANLLLLSVPVGDTDALEALRHAAVDGVAAMCCDLPSIRQARQRRLPTVVCTKPSGAGSDLADVDHVVIDDHAAGRDVGAHLRALGHRDVVILVEFSYSQDGEGVERGPEAFGELLAHHDRAATYHDTWSRIRGIVDGLDSPTSTIVTAGVNSRESGRRAGGHVLDRQHRPTAVVAVSDVLALGFIDAMRHRGLEPGRDISVVGFDDLPMAADAGLTTIRQPIAEKGRLAAELLLDPARTPRQIVLPHELVVRASTQPAPH
ncbi:MAG TPA: LacI family DNA-binding transcriptional regulator [Candidatus Avipropionibacterium avicola]|uniref:LacI family DNA-binding transcriptional regulator n=1 Tax=Candidatus Avipropionibacterium avicola TaxID=2840701 RepID=A0A9D1GVG7_9ACTN|nr:LacI family DNA-binding transcriptional regulator [Candidatus Avipropionibacterium avicola]